MTFLVAVSNHATALAQTSGVGSDEETSLMWKGYDSSIALWRLNPALTAVIAAQNYGPYIGYTPIAMTTDLFSNSHVVWSYTDGSISLWTLDPAMNFVASEVFGPYVGWNVIGMSADPYNGSIRLVWKNTDGSASIWVIDSDGNFDADITLVPGAGYAPASRRRSASAFTRHSKGSPSEKYFAHGKPPQEAAAAAMEAHRQAVRSTGGRAPEQHF